MDLPDLNSPAFSADTTPPAPPRQPPEPGPEPEPEPGAVTPPGTSATRFVESSGFKVAVGATVVLVNTIVRPYIVAKFGDAVALAFEVAEMSWLAAFGIQTTDKTSLRWK